jgi:ABC-type polysaccharide/polyol phosphate transport system ATPase subunit
VSEAAIELCNVGKRYWKVQERSLLRSLAPIGRDDRTKLWAIRGIDLTVDQGETIGLIGRNGAGKSTLLRLLAAVSQPTTGTVTMRGRIAPLLSVGVGFHQEMTGRENIFVNGMLLGLKKSEVESRFDDIVGFAELEEFIDTPVKFYSSGMYMRLGFSVAIHVEPDVLLVDEVLAVGDVAFQLRCFDRMRGLQRNGTTIVFVSHSMHAIDLLCPRTVFVHRGRVEFDGPTGTAIARYHQRFAVGDEYDDGGPVRILHRELVLPDGRSIKMVERDQSLMYRMALRFERPVDGPRVDFAVLSEDGTLAYLMATPIGDRWRSFSAGDETEVVVRFRPNFGGGGTYRIAPVITDNDTAEVLFHDHEGLSFFVSPRLGVMGPADLGAEITIDGERRTDHQPLRFEDRRAVNQWPGQAWP